MSEMKHTNHYNTINDISVILVLVGALVGALLSIYIIAIIIGLFLVSINFIFESTMVFIIGTVSYNKNFPVCSTVHHYIRG